MTRPVPRRLRVVHDWPRATAGRGRPLLEAATLVPLPRLFPRTRCVSGGRAHEDWQWWRRSLAHYGRWESEQRRSRGGVLR